MREVIEGACTIDIRAFIDRQRFSAFHWIVFALGFLIVSLDGFDNGTMSYIAPSLVQDWNIPRDAMGQVFSASLIGLSIGALLGGQIADRIGRKPVLIASVFFFGAWSFATAFATSVEALTVMRFLTGLGLGSAIPTVLTLVSEYAPARVRGIAVNAMITGFTVGLAAAGALSAWLIPKLGWKSVLFTGGLVPMLLGVVLIAWLPESAKFMVAKGRPRNRVARLLRRLAPLEVRDDCIFASDVNPVAIVNSLAVMQLLSRGYRLATTMLWLSYFLCEIVVYLLFNWLPTLFKASEFTLHDAAMTTSLFHVGGCLGLLIAGLLMDRVASIRVVALFYVLTAATVFAIGLTHGRGGLLLAMIFANGVVLSGAAGSVAPVAAVFYPTTMRATGVGWLVAIGRVGAVAGALAGGVLIARHWQVGAIFSLLAVPALIGAVPLLVLDRRFSGARRLAGESVAPVITTPRS
jgi:AAHS family 4-hydroxybenzoate transporter-like MFS transporter